MEKPKCDFRDCTNFVSDESMKFTPPTARYCAEHDNLFNDAVDSKDSKKLVSMLIKSIK